MAGKPGSPELAENIKLMVELSQIPTPERQAEEFMRRYNLSGVAPSWLVDALREGYTVSVPSVERAP